MCAPDDTPDERATSPDAGRSRTGDPGSGQYAVKSLSRGLAILKLFDLEHPRWTLGEIVRASGQHKATCYRLLRTLEQDGFVAGDPRTGEYHLGPALSRIAILAQSTGELVRVARPHLSRLVEITGETVDMTVWNESGPLLAAQVLSPARWFQPVNTVGTIFTEAPTSHVKLWLAYGTEPQRARLLSVLSTDRQGASPSDSLPAGSLDAVRAEGVAFDVGEAREVFSVAAPVFDESGRMVAAVAVVAAYERTGKTERDLYSAAVRQVTEALSRELGHVPRSPGPADPRARERRPG
jgi:DNA-binding IclR family transcriptional regulator